MSATAFQRMRREQDAAKAKSKAEANDKVDAQPKKAKSKAD